MHRHISLSVSSRKAAVSTESWVRVAGSSCFMEDDGAEEWVIPGACEGGNLYLDDRVEDLDVLDGSRRLPTWWKAGVPDPAVWRDRVEIEGGGLLARD